MDNVLVDFKSGLDKVDEQTKQEYEGRLDEIPGIFSLIPLKIHLSLLTILKNTALATMLLKPY